MFNKNSTIEISDPAVWEIIQKEGKRQEDQIELIASENYASPAVMAAQGSVLDIPANATTAAASMLMRPKRWPKNVPSNSSANRSA